MAVSVVWMPHPAGVKLPSVSRAAEHRSMNKRLFGWTAAGGSAHALGAQCLVVPPWHTVRPQQAAASPFILRQKVLDGPKGGLMRLGVQGTRALADCWSVGYSSGG